MKKLLYSILALAGVVATSCTQEHIDVTYDPTKVDAPVFNTLTVEDATLINNKNVTINYKDANYNQPVSDPVYTLYVAKAGDNMANKYAIGSVDFDKATVLEDGTKDVVVPAKAINQVLVKNLGAEYDIEQAYDFQLVAAVKNEKGTAVAGTEAGSGIKSATLIPYEIKDTPDMDLFPYMYVVGTLNGWDHGKVKTNYDFIYDYDGKGVYRGIVNFKATEPNAEFKLTGGDWGKEEHSMAEGTFEDEAASIDLVSGGGANINVYKKFQYYFFEFDKANLKFNKIWSFNTVGVIGVNNDWNTDVPMEYNPAHTRFFADITVDADCEIKVRADGDWALSWGEGAESENGANVKVAAGKYRVYLDLNQKAFTLNNEMFGKDEPDMGGDADEEESDDEAVATTEAGKFGLIGVNGNWDNDIYMYAGDGGLYYSPVVSFEGEFKIRFNNDWKVERTGTFVNVGEPFAVKQGGDNIKVDKGTYAIVYNSVEETVTVVDATKGWGLIGDALANGWDADTYKAFEGETGIFTAIAYVNEKGFKFRQDADWKLDYGGKFVKFGEPFKAEKGGDNISIAEALGEETGAWVVVTLDTTTENITVNKLYADRWSVIGEVNGTSWDADVFMWNDGSVWKSAPFIANGGFKIRKEAWSDDRGGAFSEFDKAFAVTKGGDNIKAGTDVSVTVVYDPTAETITVSEFK